MPGLIIDKLVDIVVDDMNDINIYTGKDENGPIKNIEAMERWETIAKANPSLIVLGEMSRRRFPASSSRSRLIVVPQNPAIRGPA